MLLSVNTAVKAALSYIKIQSLKISPFEVSNTSAIGASLLTSLHSCKQRIKAAFLAPWQMMQLNTDKREIHELVQRQGAVYKGYECETADGIVL